MSYFKLISGVGALAFLASCSTYDPMLKTGQNDRYSHQIDVVEETVVMEVAMSEAAPGLPYHEVNRMKAFLADYKSRGARHGPLILSVPQGSPWAAKLEQSAEQTYDLAYDYGVRDVSRSDYASNGSPDAPLVLAYRAFKAVGPNCPSLAQIDLSATSTNDPTPAFGCSVNANLAAMIADPADLLGARPEDPADTVRRVDVLTKYRTGQPTATERTDSETGAISNAVE